MVAGAHASIRKITQVLTGTGGYVNSKVHSKTGLTPTKWPQDVGSVRVIDQLKSGFPVFSFEFFPPKTPEGEQKLWLALEELKSLHPAFVSVTYGAGGSTRTKTVELTGRIKRELSLEAVAHLTCVRSEREEIRAVLAELRQHNIENILALRGDAPKNEEKFVPTQGGFVYASELTRFIGEQGGFCVGGACYPEGHMEAQSRYQDLHALKHKVEAGAEFLITQLFFDNRFYFDFVDRARAAGIQVPIIPGIMPISSVEQIQRMTKMCGASIPEVLTKELEKRRHEPERIRELGVAHATIQALGLIQGGAPGIHFYTLNSSSATRDIVTAMRMHARL